MPPDAELGPRLVAQEGRLRLLLVHLTSPALRRRAALDDLAQEVWLRVLAAPERVPPPGDDERELAGYLRLVARHVVVDVARAARAQKRDAHVVPLATSTWSRTGLGAGPADATAGPLTRLARAEDAERLAAAFERLSPDHRRVLGLRRLEGLSAAEAGRRLGRSEKAVHSLYRRALEAWGAALDDPA
ncbi:MAG: RNA polymerase sigma factor [Planctomycetes bacterium]|nr:RNA polymerase sigma factor [Planctomycetota bacterium]